MPTLAVKTTAEPHTDADRLQAKAKAKHESGERVKPMTLQRKTLTVVERQAAEDLDYPTDIERPKTRADCIDGPRPCPFVSCKHHLYLDIVTDGGNGGGPRVSVPRVKLAFPHLEVDELPETCSLDVADRGGATLEQVGDLLNVTRERARQVEMHALLKGRRTGKLRVFAEP
jgi:hypothetical protein